MALDLRRETASLLAALQFLTRLPVPSSGPYDPAWLGGAAKYFPLVGAGIGLVAALALLLAGLVWPSPIPALFAVGTAVLLTGAFHEDGLADLADAAGGISREARLAIMKDSRLGTFGALALGLALALEVASLSGLPPATAAASLVAAHAGGRAAALLAMWRAAYAGDPDQAKAPHQASRPGPGGAAFGCLVALIAILPLGPAAALAGTGFGALCALLVFGWARRALGGYTGDALGAMTTTYRPAFLLGVAASLRWS